VPANKTIYYGAVESSFVQPEPGAADAFGVEHLGIFAKGAPLIALPSWRTPRLLLSRSGGPLQRWRRAAFFPATRPGAKLRRFLIRGKAALGGGEVRRATCDRWILREFIDDCLPTTDGLAIQTRPPGPDQKLTIELRDRAGTIVGYVKFGRELLARRRLAQEHAMLARLPAGIGPIPLKFGDMGDGTALLLTPLPGRPVRSKLPPPPEVQAFARSLVVAPPLALADHPYIQELRERTGRQLDAVFEDLAGRAWPIAIGHGDFAPWNLRRNPRLHTLSAIDWEFGTAKGFPLADLAYFILQVAALVYSWPPVRSAIYARRWLAAQPALGLAEREARALIRLAMFDAYSLAQAGGFADDHKIQAWRLRIWRGSW
jgi:hypothetical protein